MRRTPGGEAMSARAATLPVKVYARAGQDTVWTTELPVKGRLVKMVAVHTGACGTEHLRVICIDTTLRPVFIGDVDPFDLDVGGVEVSHAERIKTTFRSELQTTEFLAWWEYEIAAVVG